MQDLLLGTRGGSVLTYSQQYPWRGFAAVMAIILLLDFLFRKRSSISGSVDFSGSDCDGGDHAAAVAGAVKP
jgi:hypothetical protein